MSPLKKPNLDPNILSKDKRSAEKKLELAYERLYTLMESSGDAFFSVDNDFRYTYMNHKVEETEGITRGAMLGKRMSDVFPNIVDRPYYKRYKQILKGGKPEEFEELIDDKWFDIRVFPHEEGLAIYYRDITDRKQLDQRKDEFIGMASHELKTPITSLKLYTELLQDDLAPKERKLYLTHMMTEVDRLSKLVNDMLDLSKMQIGKLQFHKRKFNLNRLAKDTVAMIQKGSKQHRITLKTPASPIEVVADEDRIEQVLLNLLTNAIKYSPDSNRVIVKVWKEKGRAVVSVQDFGVGIHPDSHKKIFKRFFQVASQKGNTFPGLGIGLYISKIIIDNHQGSFDVKSVPGKGSTMSFSIPLKSKA